MDIHWSNQWIEYTRKVSCVMPMMIETRELYIQSMHFDGTMMDKLTYAALKGLGADVSKVTVLS